LSSPRVIVFGGPSGAGKTTLVRRLLELPGVRLAVSATTRPPRPGERDGVDYHFVDERRFEEMREGGELLEWALVHGHHYGTPRSELLARSPEERAVVLDIDLQGLRNIKKLGIDHVSVFIAPPSLEALEKRLRERGTETGASLATRLEAAARELAARDEYDHVVVNDQVEEAFATLRRILGLEGGADVEGGNPTSAGRCK